MTATFDNSNTISASNWERLEFDADYARLTHYLFRYPAKFHPPVIRTLLERYTVEGDVVLDPFCGSGTLLVEASVLGRSSIGLDIDPVAVAVTQAKVHRYQIPRLNRSAEHVLNVLDKYRRPAVEYERRKFHDISSQKYEQQVRPVRHWVPAIPNLFHWFRRYVIVDLARIRRTIESVQVPTTHKMLLRIVFASIIRNASNADPVPVSGLEVTSHMRRRDAAGRLVDPFQLFERALRRALRDCESFRTRARTDAPAHVRAGSATELRRYLTHRADAVICSPPYHGAVDYYRRHQLEMFWLGKTNSQTDRLALLHSYIGRSSVPRSDPFLFYRRAPTPLAAQWEERIRLVSEKRADAFRHYINAMAIFFEQLSKYLRPGRPAVFVVGHSTWNRTEIPTTTLFAELAGNDFDLRELLWYPIKNRYMSYKRHNDASIDNEYVMVFERKNIRG